MSTSMKLQWWGYRHTSGDLQVKRWFDDPLDIPEARASDFVVSGSVYGPFVAASRKHAIAILEEKI